MHDPLSDGSTRDAEKAGSAQQALPPHAQPTDTLFAFAPAQHRDLADAPPRCLRCGYILERLATPRCPECGLPFNPLMPDTFTRAPAYVRWKYWLPGLLTAVVLSGGVCMLFLGQGIIGWGLTLGAPLALGALLGYGSRGGVIAGALLILAGVIFVVAIMNTFRLTGPLCSVILAVLFLIPTLFGVLVGKVVKGAMKGTRSYSQRYHLPAVAFLLIPAAFHAAERAMHFRYAPETVATSRVLPVPLAAAWHADLFAAGPAENRTRMMRLGLPQPRRVTGSTQVGDVKTATFSKGTLTVRVTDREEQRVLAYRFVGQSKVEDNAVKLLDGRFDYEPAGTDATRVTVSTRYQPLMTPRWYWRTMERTAGHSMHGHLLDELERSARVEPATQPSR